jgi:hypothetical protein
MLQSCPKVQTLHLRCDYDNSLDYAMCLNATWTQAADLEVTLIDGPYDRVEAPEHDWVLGVKDVRSRWLDFGNAN